MFLFKRSAYGTRVERKNKRIWPKQYCSCAMKEMFCLQICSHMYDLFRFILEFEKLHLERKNIFSCLDLRRNKFSLDINKR